MTDIFHTRIRKALANPSLQAALDGNAEKRRTGHQQAFAALADPQGMRRSAHAVRAEVINNLESYLERFIEKARENGMTIHHAADAGQAVGIVLEIARQRGAKLVAKSKTMVSEEVGLNHALEQAGLRVVETDLGEYIVQLRGETPAHIVTPAVHLRRGEVGQTFHEKLGIPYTEDIPTLTQTARAVLREVFLSADIGISGVNFGVAETGTLCILTNEGNGRMVTTVPPVHIALMGIERLVPGLEDLALMLGLLPRASTGQKLTVYGSLIHGPRRVDDPDGPQERHLVMVDNGRRAVQRSPLAEILYCIRCGACLNACPVFREIGGHAYVSTQGRLTPYSGPVGSVVSPALFGQAEFGHLARASSLCGACREVCPVDIDLPRLLLRVRAGMAPAGKQPELERQPAMPNPPTTLALVLRLYAWAASASGRFRLAQGLAGIAARLLPARAGADGHAWLRLPANTGWGWSKDFPRPARGAFHKQFKPTRERLPLVEASRPPAAPILMPKVSQARVISGLVKAFADELVVLGGKCESVSEPMLAARLQELLQERGITSLLAWKAGLPPGLLGDLRAAGVKVYTSMAEVKEASAPIPRAGLTGALAGVAETGTLLLPGGAGRPLSASLLGEVHIAILRTEAIYASLGEVLGLAEVREASAAALVTGPSRTADIEMTLTIGVHGPGEVIVLCI